MESRPSVTRPVLCPGAGRGDPNLVPAVRSGSCWCAVPTRFEGILASPNTTPEPCRRTAFTDPATWCAGIRSETTSSRVARRAWSTAAGKRSARRRLRTSSSLIRQGWTSPAFPPFRPPVVPGWWFGPRGDEEGAHPLTENRVGHVLAGMVAW